MSQLLHQTLGGFLHTQADLYADNDALVSENVKYTYSQLLRSSSDEAKRLLSAGIRRGTHVGIWSNDSPDMMVLMFALWRLGAVAMPICTSFGTSELEGLIEDGDMEYMLIDSGYKDSSFPKLCRQLSCPSQSHIIAMNHVEASGYPRISDYPCAGDGELDYAEKQVNEDDTDTILFTSGSTGKSKPVETSHFSRMNTLLAQAKALEATQKDRFCSVLPLYHCFSLTAVVLAAVAAGACVCFPKSRRTQDILNCIEKERCTVLTAVPTLFSAIMRRQSEMRADISSLRTGMIGGSTYPPDMFVRICRELDYTLLPSLGQTEATAGITSGRLSDNLYIRSTTLGVAFSNVELKIKVDNDKPQGSGNPGEICIRGFNVMKGYYRQQEVTRQVIDGEGWLHTGDMGWLDSDNRLHYSGRIKNLIIRGGENIFPEEVEHVLLSDSRIAECKVVGVPDPHYIEELCACVVLNPGGKLGEQEVRDAVAALLSPFKVPRYVMFLDSLPRTTTGKIDGVSLKAMVRQKLC